MLMVDLYVYLHLKKKYSAEVIANELRMVVGTDTSLDGRLVSR